MAQKKLAKRKYVGDSVYIKGFGNMVTGAPILMLTTELKDGSQTNVIMLSKKVLTKLLNHLRDVGYWDMKTI